MSNLEEAKETFAKHIKSGFPNISDKLMNHLDSLTEAEQDEFYNYKETVQDVFERKWCEFVAEYGL